MDYTEIPTSELQESDELVTGEIVTAVYADVDNGVWVEFSDGHQGYVNPNKMFRVI